MEEHEAADGQSGRHQDGANERGLRRQARKPSVSAIVLIGCADLCRIDSVGCVVFAYVQDAVGSLAKPKFPGSPLPCRRLQERRIELVTGGAGILVTDNPGCCPFAAQIPAHHC